MITKNELLDLRMFYSNINKDLISTYKFLDAELPPRYYMNLGIIEFIDYILIERILDDENEN